MAQQDAVIRLLLVEDRLEDAEQLISHLRNGGMAVRPHRPENEEDLGTLLSSQSIDLVLAAFDAAYIPIAHVVERVTATGKDIPVVAASATLDEKLALSALCRPSSAPNSPGCRRAAGCATSRRRCARPSAAAIR